MKHFVGLVWILFLLTGCYSQPIEQSSLISRDDYDQPTLTSSLFKSDQEVLGEDAIQTILSSKLVLPQSAKMALMKFPDAGGLSGRYYGYNYWRTETYLKTQQEFIDALSSKISSSIRINEVILLPSLLTPKDSTIPVLREAAVRLQAELLLVFKLSSDIYYQESLFTKDKVKAYCTCEAVLLDVRTGVIPFTKVVTREQLASKEKTDMDINETMRRAEKQAVLQSLDAVGNDLVKYFASVP